MTVTDTHAKQQPQPPGAPLPADACDSVRLLGQRFDRLTECELITHVLVALDRGLGGWIVTANLDHLRRQVREAEYRRLSAQASLVVADGMPLIWAARLQGTPLPERVAGSNLISTLSEAAAGASRRVFLIGGAPGTADATARVLGERYSGLRVAGTMCPPMGFEHDPAQLEMIETALVQAQPDIVYVGLGSPKQEHLIERYRKLLPGAWWIGVGVSFSFLCGDVRRAPPWMQLIGLEWLHRLAQEPRRLVRRYLLQGLPFAGRLTISALWGRLRGRPATDANRENG